MIGGWLPILVLNMFILMMVLVVNGFNQFRLVLVGQQVLKVQQETQVLREIQVQQVLKVLRDLKVLRET